MLREAVAGDVRRYVFRLFRLLGRSSELSETFGAEGLGQQSSGAVWSSAVSD